jgi:hypothetical protein
MILVVKNYKFLLKEIFSVSIDTIFVYTIIKGRRVWLLKKKKEPFFVKLNSSSLMGREISLRERISILPGEELDG